MQATFSGLSFNSHKRGDFVSLLLSSCFMSQLVQNVSRWKGAIDRASSNRHREQSPQILPLLPYNVPLSPTELHVESDVFESSLGSADFCVFHPGESTPPLGASCLIYRMGLCHLPGRVLMETPQVKAFHKLTLDSVRLTPFTNSFSTT